jgi:hypothetical protein
LGSAQASVTRNERAKACLAGAVFVLGYWRSGTTLLHDYLGWDKRFAYPTTYACMHPHHFVLTQRAALAKPQPTVRRPMDDVQISSSSPQEDEFALLGLGARSPYEALMAPEYLAEALALGDPRDLSPAEESQWREVFIDFLRGVSVVEGGRPLLLKSPPHGYRVATLRELLPDARFILIVRSPEAVFESAVRMWRTLFPIYALQPLPPEEHTRSVVLRDRLRFETKLAAGLEGLPQDRLVLVRYEELVRDPLGTLRQIYEQLQLGEYRELEAALRASSKLERQYSARNAMPPEGWMRRMETAWAPVFEKYQYSLKRN